MPVTPTYPGVLVGEIEYGAKDASERSGYHDLYRLQREANLHTRLDEFTPAELQTAIIFAS